MTIFSRLFLMLAVAWSTGCTASRPADFPQTYVAGWTGTPPVIDGRLDEPVWNRAPWTERFRDIEGDVRPRPRFETRAKMMWDEEYFYIAADMEEPHVWGTLTARDSIIYNDNDFEVFIDPDADNYDYYELEVNALNTQFDLMLSHPYRCGGSYDIGWDIDGLQTAVAVDGTLNDSRDEDRGWSMEIAIPWASLRSHANRRIPPVDGEQWPVNFSRVQWRHQLRPDGSYERLPEVREDNWTWTPQDAIDMHRPEYWGLVQFSDQPPGDATFDVRVEDRVWTILRRLHHAAEQFRATHDRWPTSAAEVGFVFDPAEVPGLTSPILDSDGEGVVIEATLRQTGRERVFRFGPACARSVR